MNTNSLYRVKLETVKICLDTVHLKKDGSLEEPMLLHEQHRKESMVFIKTPKTHNEGEQIGKHFGTQYS